MTILQELHTKLLEKSDPPELAQSINTIKDELNQLYDAQRELKRRGASMGQGAVAPQFQNQFNKIRSMIKVRQDKIKQTRDAYYAQQDSEDWKRQQAQRPELSKADQQARRGDAIQSGKQHFNNLKQRYGGETGLEDAIISKAWEFSNEGRRPLDVAELADEFGISNVRSMYKWLERPRVNKAIGLLKRIQGGWGKTD